MTVKLHIVQDAEGHFVLLDVTGELTGQKGAEVGGAPTKQEALQLQEEILRAFRTGEGR